MSVRTSTKSPGGGGGGSDYYVRELIPSGERYNQATCNAVTVGMIYYIPFQIIHPVTIDAVIVAHAAAAGNMYVAIYDSDAAGLPRNRLAVSASIVAAGANSRQTVMLTATISLGVGLYFGAVEGSDAALTIASQYGNTDQLAGDGICHYSELLGAYAIPPAAATPVKNTLSSNKHLRLRVSSVP